VVQLQLNTPDQAAVREDVRRFPFRVGRSDSSDLVVQADGVWDHHLELDFDPARGILVSARSGALLTVNGEAVDQARLANGDLVGLGAASLRFGFSPLRQRRMWVGEAMVWLSLVALTAGQLALIYWLLTGMPQAGA